MTLYKQTVVPETWKLLNSLMQIPELSSFMLVGGTNLSLQLGHRISVDLDLFTNTPFDVEVAKYAIEKALPETVIHGMHGQSIWMMINGVKIKKPSLPEWLFIEFFTNSLIQRSFPHNRSYVRRSGY